MFDYQLTDDDLREVFSKYGRISSVDAAGGTEGAVVTFDRFEDAAEAVNDLNMKKLYAVQGHLKVSWVAPSIPSMMAVPPASVVAAIREHSATQELEPLAKEKEAVSDENLRTLPATAVIRKYTARFEIGIANEREFQVARRIIGAKGANMKRIVSVSEAKLRLRGRGSGFLEGSSKLESAEPLHLCVSCKDYVGYQLAIKQVTELLDGVYESYRDFLSQKGQPYPPSLGVSMREQAVLADGSPAPAAVVESDVNTGRALRYDQDGQSEPTPAGRSRTESDRGTPMQSPANAPDRDAELTRPQIPPPGMDVPAADEIEKRIHERNEARRVSNFAEADRIRMMLWSRGVALMDEPGGRGRGQEVTKWRYWRP
jgi:hypothetical protein